MYHCENRWANYDLTLKNGRRKLVPLNPALIICPVEIPYHKLKLTKNFPFVHVERKTCVKFTQKMDDGQFSEEETYIIDCSLTGFISMFGIESKWNRAMMKSDIRNGEH